MTLQFRILSRSGRELTKLTLPSSATTDDLKKEFYKQFRKYTPDRQYFTKGLDDKRIVLTPGSSLVSLGLNNNDDIYFKDLGYQIGWKTVFFTEYAGPIIIHLLVYLFPQFIYYGYDIKPKSYTQTMALLCVVGHYLKREYETACIHRFSNGTMPLFNIFKNSFHYWMTGGLFIAYFLYHPLYTETKSELFINICVGLFIIMELGNLYSHIILRNLRAPGTRERGVPKGFLFNYVTCANYTFELAAWLLFSLFTQTLTAYLFFAQSFVQIAIWSLKKHKALKKEFGDKAPKRKILVPFIW